MKRRPLTWAAARRRHRRRPRVRVRHRSALDEHGAATWWSTAAPMRPAMPPSGSAGTPKSAGIDITDEALVARFFDEVWPRPTRSLVNNAGVFSNVIQARPSTPRSSTHSSGST